MKPTAFLRLLAITFLLSFAGILAAQKATQTTTQKATAPSSITVKKGFKVELLHSATKEEGSWISLTAAPGGQLYIAKDSKGILRVKLPTKDSKLEIEPIDDTLRHCRGLLYAHNSLYISATNTKAIYRWQDQNKDGEFETKEQLATVNYNSRYGHGTNQIVLGPDNQIYWVFGNDIEFIEAIDPNSPYRNPQNDWLVPNPHDLGQDNRVGHILKMSPDGKQSQVICGGLRNQCDIAFNEDGEMFTFDADMEWDYGTHWYRPIRVNHLVSGGEYGWRWATGKWPTYYFDSLPSNLDVGLGSPTGVLFGTKTNFPERYQRAFYFADWQNGRILMADVYPDGASYRLKDEVFIEGGPLNVCDMVVGEDQNIYFVTGGRGSQTGLYRISFDKANYDPSAEIDWKSKPESVAKGKTLRGLRHQLETYHTKKDPKAIDLLWENLSHEDRWIRFAARVALENQDPVLWLDRATKETNPLAAINSLAAATRLCQTNKTISQQKVFTAITKLPLLELETSLQVDLLRLYHIALVRTTKGARNDTQLGKIASECNQIYPSTDTRINELACEVLVSLNHKEVITKSLQIMESDISQEEQLAAAHLICRMKSHWNPAHRRRFLQWLIKARTFRGGKFLTDEVTRMRTDFESSMSKSERAKLTSLFKKFDSSESLADSLPPRPTVKVWSRKEVESIVAASKNSNVELGRKALVAANCLNCHRYGSTGSNIGPDLSAIGSRFDTKAILDSIFEPSKVIDPKYGYTTYELASGKTVSGRQAHVTGTEIKIETSAIAKEMITIKRDNIEFSYPAKISPMPTGLLNTLEEKEIAALIDLLRRSKKSKED